MQTQAIVKFLAGRHVQSTRVHRDDDDENEIVFGFMHTHIGWLEGAEQQMPRTREKI